MNEDASAVATVFVHSTGSGPLLWSTVPAGLVPGRMLHPSNVGYPPGEPVARGVTLGAGDDARHVLAQIPADVKRVHVVGHSYGALVSLHLVDLIAQEARPGLTVGSLFFYEPVLFGALAKASPEALDAGAVEDARTFLEHPWFLTDTERGGREEWLETFIDYWNRPGAWQKMPEGLREVTRAVGWKMFQEVRSCFFDVTSFEAWRVAVPATIVRGERSPRASRAMAQALAQALPAGTLVDVERTGHMAPLTHPGIVHTALRGHFERVPA